VSVNICSSHHHCLNKKNYNSENAQRLRERKKIHKENNSLYIIRDSNGSRNRIRVLLKAQQKDKHLYLFKGRDARRYALLNYVRNYPVVSLW
jgi:hypothetical protein